MKSLTGLAACIVSGIEPDIMEYGPVHASNKLQDKTGLKICDIDLFGIDETFAGQFLNVVNDLKLDPSRINVNGVTIPLGHPVDAAGAQIIVLPVLEITNRKLWYAHSALHIGGITGTGLLVERV